MESRLRQRGRSASGCSDAQLLLSAYLAYGPDCAAALNSPFAFAIWDEWRQQLLLARDRFGQKPLYYAFTEDGHLLFASEIKALLASGLLLGKLDRAAVDNYLTLLYVPPYRTIFSNVHILEPASYLVYSRDGLETGTYWQPSFERIPITQQEAREELRRLLRGAVRRRLTDGTSTGAFLSGGLDSTVVSYLVNEAGDQPIKTFSAGFGSYASELPYARQAAELCGSDHYEMNVTVDDLPDLLLEMARWYDEPFADSANVPTYLLARYARERGVQMVFTGDGPDQMIASAAYRHLDRAVQQRVFRKLWDLPTFKFWWRRPVLRELWDLFGKRLGQQYYLCHTRRIGFFSQEERQALWAVNGCVNDDPVRYYRPDGRARGIDQALWFDLHCYLPGDVLTKVDRAAMAASLQTRAPFLDPDVVDFALSLPCSYRVREDAAKCILKEAFAGLVPDAILHKPKQGFGAPVEHWLRQPALRNLTLTYLKSPTTRIKELFRADAVSGLMDDVFAAGEGPSRWERWRQAYKLWTLLALELWLQQWSDHIDIGAARGCYDA
jgi:asparagine synthase (glutamine-hydrolysing)